MTKNIYAISAHEAGHACAAILLGVGVHSATIKPTADSLGRVDLRDSDLDGTTHAGRLVIAQIYLAGCVAEEIINGSTPPAYSGYDSDEAVIRDLELGWWEIREARRKVSGLLCANYNELNEVTWSLYQNEYLSGAAIFELMGFAAPAIEQVASTPGMQSPAEAAPHSEDTPAEGGTRVVIFDTGARSASRHWLLGAA